MSLAYPTIPSILNPAPIPAIGIANGSMGTIYGLDLRNKWGAVLYPRIGRRGATALTRSGYVAVRRTLAGALVHPGTAYDAVSSITAGASTTVASGGAQGTNSVTLTSATGFSIGDTICLHSDDLLGNRVEFSKIIAIATNTLTLESALKSAHSAADRVTNMADIWTGIWLPGGDRYDIWAVNPSGQDLVFAVDAYTYDSDTNV